MLAAEHITVRYGTRTVVSDLSFHLRPGQWLMLAGPNGAGKTTLIEAITQGVPYSGSFRWYGRDLKSVSPGDIARGIGVGELIFFNQYACVHSARHLEVDIRGRKELLQPRHVVGKE